MIPLYLHRSSPIHKISPGVKLLSVAIGGTAIFLIKSVWLLMIVLAAIFLLYRLAELSLQTALNTLRPLLWAGLIIFAAQLILSSLETAAAVTMRISSAVLLTSLVTLTTRFSDMLDTLTHVARPLARIGFNPTHFALMVGLTIRFIPTLIHDLQEIRNAKLARGAKGLRSFGAGPAIIKILRMTDALGNAIAARNFENRKDTSEQG